MTDIKETTTQTKPVEFHRTGFIECLYCGMIFSLYHEKGTNMVEEFKKTMEAYIRHIWTEHSREVTWR